MKLSDAQRRMIAEIERNGNSETPFIGGRGAGRAASAWYRTAFSLADRELVELVKWGDHYRAKFPARNENRPPKCVLMGCGKARLATSVGWCADHDASKGTPYGTARRSRAARSR